LGGFHLSKALDFELEKIIKNFEELGVKKLLLVIVPVIDVENYLSKNIKIIL
jgi:metal-dependent hydrolase (beta-lactamase superfamily II)